MYLYIPFERRGDHPFDVSLIIHYDYGYLSPFSTIFQLYRGDHSYWWWKLKYLVANYGFTARRIRLVTSRDRIYAH